jgi:hypothetical protein
MRTSVVARCLTLATLALSATGVLAGPVSAASTQTFVRTFRPHPTSTHEFTGYETLRVRAPNGGSVVRGSARVVGGDPGAVVVRQVRVNPQHTRLLVRLEFPGEQGTPGLVRVRIVTVAPSSRRVTLRFKPQATRTVGFNGFERIVARLPGGGRIGSASARIAGGDFGSVFIRSTGYTRGRRGYVVRLVFPGTQGRPGTLVVTLVAGG